MDRQGLTATKASDTTKPCGSWLVDRSHAPLDRSHAPRGNAMHPLTLRVTCCPAGRGASQAAFPRRAWERSKAYRYRRQASSHTGFCTFMSVA
ncbi:hypothetical protein FJ692_19980 [Pseudomonas fluorescens]|nr:hypothetical protein FJ692_19980 [Pseudomonas fluorescens]